MSAIRPLRTYRFQVENVSIAAHITHRQLDQFNSFRGYWLMKYQAHNPDVIRRRLHKPYEDAGTWNSRRKNTLKAENPRLYIEVCPAAWIS